MIQRLPKQATREALRSASLVDARASVPSMKETA